MDETIDYTGMRNLFEQRNAALRPIPFGIVYVTANREKKTGGEFITVDYAVKHANLRFAPKQSTKKTTTTAEHQPLKRDPNHWVNQTTNIAILAKDELTGKLKLTQEVRKIHYRSILFINGKRVV